FSRRALKIQVGASDRDQAAEVRSAAEDIVREVDCLRGMVSIDQWQIKCESTGSVCRILAADAAGASGGRPDVLLLEELVMIGDEDFATNLLNNASKIPGSLTIIQTNAGFQNTWQWRLRELARTSDRWYFLQGNDRPPQISAEEYEEARV